MTAFSAFTSAWLSQSGPVHANNDLIILVVIVVDPFGDRSIESLSHKGFGLELKSNLSFYPIDRQYRRFLA
jgi:hypothetical protein